MLTTNFQLNIDSASSNEQPESKKEEDFFADCTNIDDNNEFLSNTYNNNDFSNSQTEKVFKLKENIRKRKTTKENLTDNFFFYSLNNQLQQQHQLKN